MNTVIIETIVSVLANLAVTLIGVAGAWLLAQISKNQQLNTINTAVGELTAAAEQTVLELQQTVVDGLKEASSDGKLTQEEITKLGKLLLDGTLAKMSDSGIGVLKAANVDINAIVTGAGEALIARIKQKEEQING
jgi:translation elongation factor EF-G